MYKNFIFCYPGELHLDIHGIINASLQVMDFHLFNPRDHMGNEVSALYLHWLGTVIEEQCALTYNPKRPVRPPFDLELALKEDLREYEEDMFQTFMLPKEAAASAAELGFDLTVIGPGHVVLSLEEQHRPTAEQRQRLRHLGKNRTLHSKYGK